MRRAENEQQVSELPEIRACEHSSPCRRGQEASHAAADRYSQAVVLCTRVDACASSRTLPPIGQSWKMGKMFYLFVECS